MTAACIACGYDASAVVAFRWSFFVELDSKSMNVYLSNAGPTRFAYKRERQAWQLMIRSAINKTVRSPSMPRATRFRRVTLTRFYDGRQQLRDADNYIGGCKPLLDALVCNGVLLDDSADFAQVIYKQERRPPVGMQFIVEELESTS